VSEVAWTRAEFEDRLRAKERFYHIHHPFHVLMNTGKLEREAIQGWVANRFYYQVSIPIKDAAVLANCPDRAVRREWIKRIIDHDGQRLDGWPKHYPWIEPEGYAYFRKRLSEARRDVEHGLAITLDHFRTRDEQERALGILQFKLDVLWTLLDCMWLAYVDRRPPYYNVEP
jgi:pyrroloquinoline quinone (PQQ) biosynthesis protein C